MNYDMTEGSITKNLLKFAFPLMIGNLLQQLYNIADTLIVGRYLGENALAAVGSSYTLMVFLTSILLGLCMGSGAFFSMQFGSRNFERLKNGFFLSFVLIGGITLVLNGIVYLGMDAILWFLRVPKQVLGLMQEYLWYIFLGLSATFLYNYFASLLRAIGNSVVPLCFLGISAVINIGLDLLFILVFAWGVKGAAAATVLAQYFSGVGMVIYYWKKCPLLQVERKHCYWDGRVVKEIAGLSVLTCMQQSIMNFGILMVQGLVNSFGSVVMAGFAAAVKIDSFAYSPVQDFGNAFSTYVAQNFGAGKRERIEQGMKGAVLAVLGFCLVISCLVCGFARPLMEIFIDASRTDIVEAGVGYLRIEATFYVGIGLLFLLYGYYRAVRKPGMSVILTIISLGTRVVLAYMLSGISWIGVRGIWAAVPIGWGLADLVGVWYFWESRKKSGEKIG